MNSDTQSTDVVAPSDEKTSSPSPAAPGASAMARMSRTRSERLLDAICALPGTLPDQQAPQDTEQLEHERQYQAALNQMQASLYEPDRINPLLSAADALLLPCALLQSEPASQLASEAWYEESPILHGAARWPEFCAGVCMSAFGEELVPEVDQDRYGTDAQNALQIARVYLAAPPNSDLRQAMEVLALVIHRMTNENYSLSTD